MVKPFQPPVVLYLQRRQVTKKTVYDEYCKYVLYVLFLDYERGVDMPNITLSIPEDLLKESRKYAKKNNTTLNNLVRELLKKVFNQHKSGWLTDSFLFIDKHPVNSKGLKIQREDLYDV